MMDKSIEFYKILMRRKTGVDLVEFKLPVGYSFKLYTEGDAKFWADIEHSVQEFDTRKSARGYFEKRYLPYNDELEKRCMFVEDSKGIKIATFTVWWEYLGSRRYPWISWVAVKPEHQRKGIGKALIYRGMKLLLDIEGDVEAYLKTQTWSYKAINIYKEQGFEIVKEVLDPNWNSSDYDKMMSVLRKHLR